MMLEPVPDDAYPLVPAASALGNLGEDALSFLMRKIGFGLAPNPTDDNGNTIDRFVFITGPADDGRLRQLGLITAQVKTGASFMTAPTDDGWWHTMSAREATVPLTKPLGHIVVLVDPHGPVAYWAELTPQSRVSTGKGYKLFVPAAQTVSQDCVEALRDVWRRTEMRRRGWTKSSWIAPGETPISDNGDRLVAAILTPRLVAPHPNLVRPGRGPVSAEQALALICGGRIPELADNLSRFRAAAQPEFEGMADHDDWRWRLAAALVDYPDISEHRLIEITDAVDDATGRAVATIVHATWLARVGRPEEAAEILTRVGDHATGLVAGWMLVHRARIARRLGNLDIAVRLLDEALLHVVFDDRPWATAVTAAIMSAKLSTEVLTGDAAARAVAANDNEQAWWTAQIRSSILDDHLNAQMGQFLTPGSMRFQFEDVSLNRARGLVLAADLSGNEGRYRYELRLAGRDLATRHPDDPLELAAAMEMLRLAGEGTDVANLIRRVRDLDGDVELTRRWAEISHLSRWTQPVAANVAFARGVVDLIDDESIRAWVGELARHAFSSQSPSNVDLDSAIRMAATTIRVAAPDDQLTLFDLSVSAAERLLPDARVADECAHLVAALDTAAVVLRAPAIAAVMDRAVSYRFEIAAALDHAGVEAGVAEVEQLASGGDMRAVCFLLQRERDISFVDPATVAAQVRAAIASASSGVRTYGGGSQLAMAALWAAYTGDSLVASMLADLLADQEIAGDFKCNVLFGLLGTTELRVEAVEPLRHVAARVSVPPRWDFEVPQASERALRTATQAVGSRLEDLDVAAISGMLGSPHELDRELGARLAHRWAVPYNERELVVALLSRLLSDPEPSLRRTAARLIADLASEDGQASEVLRSLLPNLRRPELRAMLAALIAKERIGSPRAPRLIEHLAISSDLSADHATARLLRRRGQ